MTYDVFEIDFRLFKIAADLRFVAHVGTVGTRMAGLPNANHLLRLGWTLALPSGQCLPLLAQL